MKWEISRMIFRVMLVIGLYCHTACLWAIFEIGGMEGEGLKEPLKEETPAGGKEDGQIRTIQCHEPYTNVPNFLQSGQRLIIFLDNLTCNSYIVQTVISSDNPNIPADVSLVWNEAKGLFSRQITDSWQMVEAVVPSSAIVSTGNMLQIRNEGVSGLRMKYICISYLSQRAHKKIMIYRNFPETKDASTFFSFELPASFAQTPHAFELFYREAQKQEREISMEVFKNAEILGILECGQLDGLSLKPDKQVRKMKSFLCNILRWFSGGGTGLVIKNFEGCGYFINEYGSKRAPYFAVERAGWLFDGNPTVFPLNVMPTAKGKILKGIEWLSVSNKEGVATILIASANDNAENILVSGILPWSGKTKFEAFSGFAEEENKCGLVPSIKKLSEETLDIEAVSSGGLFEKTFSLDSCILLRMTRVGSALPEKNMVFMPSKEYPLPAFKEDIIKVTQTHPYPHLERQILRFPNGFVASEGTSMEHEYIDATRAQIEGVKNLVPWDTKSILLKISSGKDLKKRVSSARIYIIPPNERMAEMSFWIYPRMESSETQKICKLNLRYGNSYLSKYLKTEKWHRISFPLKNQLGFEFIDIFAIPDAQSEKKYSLEINGIQAIGKDDIAPPLLLNPLLSGNFQLILVDKPGKKIEYTYFSRKAIKPDSITCDDSSLKISYMPEAQILMLSGVFPPYSPDNPALGLISTDDAKKVRKEEKSILAISFSTE